MSILFSVIAINKKIIYKHASCEGNFVDIVSEVLSKIPYDNNKMTYLHGKYLLNYIVEHRHVYLCVTDKTCQRSRAFLYLNEIKRNFNGKDKDDFKANLAAEMLRYSQDYSNIKIQDGELDEINKIEVGCSESILGEKVLMVSNKDNMEFSKISYVGRPPEKISISIKSSNSYVIFAMAGLILTVGIMYILGPATLIIIIGIFVIISMKQKK